MFNNTDLDRKISREMQQTDEKKHQGGDSQNFLRQIQIFL